MGSFVRDDTVFEVQHQRNARFRKGHALDEMVQIHREFGLFSGGYSLRQASQILNIAPKESAEKARVHAFLDRLRDYPSDRDGVNGHDRILQAYKENLESANPLPVHHTYHRSADDRRVLVTQGRPVIYEDQDYVVISLPTIPARGGS
jgi:hypothetical protein